MNKPQTAVMVSVLISLAHSGTAFGQTYNFSAPVASPAGSGFQEIPFIDLSNPSDPFGKGFSSEVSFGTVNGTLIYNSAASTMRFLGNVSISYSTYSESFNDNQTINGSLVPASVSVNYSIGNVNNGVLSFDTGMGPVGSLNLPLPISGTYSLATGGQAYSGAFDYTLDLPINIILKGASSTSLNFNLEGKGQTLYVPLAQVTAGNGVQLDLAAMDPADGYTDGLWSMDNITAVAAVPEPSSLALFGCGLLGIGFLGRRRLSGHCK